MKLPLLATLLLTIAAISGTVNAQPKKPTVQTKPRPSAAKAAEVGKTAVVVDETLSVVREEPSLYARPIHRIQRGRNVQIVSVAEADGVKFFKIAAPPSSFGWVQADAVFGRFRTSDDERLARLVQALDGFDHVEAAGEYFALFPESKFRPAILLLYGDILELIAAKLSKDASSRLNRSEMAASNAPMHSYYLNFNMLDRYRKLGVVFLFNSATKQYHYNGGSWAEIIKKHAGTPEAVEAQKRMDSLKAKMEKRPTK
ncbi:MAG: hypothetical protein KA956_08830 [Pyrinomonadaceae bacterium]|nr:hypothetical protein [Acidobacteriota bacterium]MBP7376570.1 hypothetical protein [Pyrinomonadaceae bacterium]